MDVSGKIAQKLAVLFALTAVLLVPSEFVGGFVKAAPSESNSSELVGKPAPDFSLPDAGGKTKKLSDYKGKIVVLEWFNHGCPFVKKHYNSGNMQKLQDTYEKKGVVWLSICSSAEGKQGYASGEEHAKVFKDKNSKPTAILLDSDGTVGKAYDAKATPSMYVIDKKGVLVYAGAIDDKNGTDQAEIKDAKNYVSSALDEVLKEKAVSTASTKAYGCSVKYK